MSNATHWTERSPEDFLYSVASDFVEQIQKKMKTLGMRPSELAKVSKVSKGRISQIFKDPGNISLDTMIKFARALGLKLLVSAYEDVNDPHNERGPINGEVFNILWKRAGYPFDMWDIRELPHVAATGDTQTLPPFYWDSYKYKNEKELTGALIQKKDSTDKTQDVINFIRKGGMAYG